MFKIEKLTAFIAIDDKSGDEGIIAMKVNNDWMPLVAADSVRANQYREYAQEIAKENGTKVTMAEFSVRKDTETYEYVRYQQ